MPFQNWAWVLKENNQYIVIDNSLDGGFRENDLPLNEIERLLSEKGFKFSHHPGPDVRHLDYPSAEVLGIWSKPTKRENI